MNHYVASNAAWAVSLAMLFALPGCNASEETTTADNAALAAPAPAGMLRGTVLETMDSGGYTYVLIDTNEDQRWAATQLTAVNVGDVVQIGTAGALPEGHPVLEMPARHPSFDTAACAAKS